MNNKYNKIVFYNDIYDGEQLIWQAGKEYKILGESNELYICESEPYLKDNSIESISYGVEKSIMTMYYLI